MLFGDNWMDNLPEVALMIRRSQLLIQGCQSTTRSSNHSIGVPSRSMAVLLSHICVPIVLQIVHASLSSQLPSASGVYPCGFYLVYPHSSFFSEKQPNWSLKYFISLGLFKLSGRYGSISHKPKSCSDYTFFPVYA